MGKTCMCTPAHQVHPHGRARVNFRIFLLGGVRGDLEVYLVYLDRLLRATTKKVVNFFEEKSAPPDKILDTPMQIRVSTVTLSIMICTVKVKVKATDVSQVTCIMTSYTGHQMTSSTHSTLQPIATLLLTATVSCWWLWFSCYVVFNLYC